MTPVNFSCALAIQFLSLSSGISCWFCLFSAFCHSDTVSTNVHKAPSWKRKVAFHIKWFCLSKISTLSFWAWLERAFYVSEVMGSARVFNGSYNQREGSAILTFHLISADKSGTILTGWKSTAGTAFQVVPQWTGNFYLDPRPEIEK